MTIIDMSLKEKIFIFIIICIIVLSATIIVYMGNQALNLIEKNESLEKDFLANAIQRKKNEQLKKAKTTALSIAHNTEVQTAFAARDREKLLKMLNMSYEEVKEYFPQWQFHLPDSTSFLRLHMPNYYGDDLSGFRYTVNKANQSQEIIAGLEGGRAGYGFRVVVPIFYEAKHVGSMELGSEFNENFLQDLQNDFDGKYFLHEFDKEKGNYKLIATAQDNDYKKERWKLGDELLEKIKNGSQITKKVKEGYCSLLVIPVKDYSDQFTGYIKVVRNRSGFIEKINSSKHNMYILGLISALSIAVFIFIFLTYSLRPLDDLLTATKKIGAGDLNYRISWGSIDNELRELAQAFNEMVAKLQRSNAERNELLTKVQFKEQKRQELLNKLIIAQEEERKRIARELHDETGQALTSLNLSLSNLKKIKETEEFNNQIAMMKDIIDKLFNQLNQLAKQLRPDVLDDLGLKAAIKNYIKDSSRWWGQEIGLYITGLDSIEISKEIEIAVYRIIQEALTNAFRHSNANNISVLIKAENSEISIIVEDDGCGFNLEEVMSAAKNEKCLGLFGMQERAELLGGRLTIESKKNIGTTVYINMPLQNN
ncbi:cache domain-containing protein [Fuchsiella alkaliacetigena]|uniref:cache domain-containing protein n=1 Tax=Fuchsiella alkaliacetigena TaxID=957042 RepID=UPI00200AAC4B|nr:cache domain-containing protein [Fuchsiella alkaliacetigena]